ncbi:MAG: adenosine deaminase, partial [Oscillospiraceae bacterium]|nr:adenosine deaminase [Oscillospiraceae bacterium]
MKTPGLIDLHLHLDGSLSVKSVKELAALQNIEIPENEEELLKLLRINDDCKDLTEYLEKFAFPGMLLQTKEAVALSVYNLQEELKEQGLIHAEIRFAPQLHTRKGLSQDDAIQAVLEGRRQGLEENPSIKIGIICCMMCVGTEKVNWDKNMETASIAHEYMNDGVVCVDLAGAEGIVPLSNFAPLFKKAQET